MNTTEHTAPPRPAGAYEPPTSVERTEEVLSGVGVAAVVTLRIVELAVIAVIALLIVPPFAILFVVVAVPAIALAAVVAVVAVPVFVVRHAQRHRAAHAHHVIRRLADWGRAEEASASSSVRRAVARAQRKLYAKPTR